MPGNVLECPTVNQKLSTHKRSSSNSITTMMPHVLCKGLRADAITSGTYEVGSTGCPTERRASNRVLHPKEEL